MFIQLGLQNTPTASLQSDKIPSTSVLDMTVNHHWFSRLELQNTPTGSPQRGNIPPKSALVITLNPLLFSQLELQNTPSASVPRCKIPLSVLNIYIYIYIYNTRDSLVQSAWTAEYLTASLQRGKTPPISVLDTILSYIWASRLRQQNTPTESLQKDKISPKSVLDMTLDMTGSVGWGCRIHRLHICRGIRLFQ